MPPYPAVEGPVYGPEIFLKRRERSWRAALLHGLWHALVLLGVLYPVDDDARCSRCGRRWW